MNMQDKLTETTISLLKEAYMGIDANNLENYIKNNINIPLQNSALRIYNAIDFDISEKDKRILSLALKYRFAGTTSTIPPFILDALGQDRLKNNYPKVGTIKWFIDNPQAIQLYYDKYRGTNKLPYTDTTDQIDLDKKEVTPEDEAKQLYKSSKFIKYIYQFNSDEKFNIDDIKNYINNTKLPIIVQYGAFNKDYTIKDKQEVLKSLDYYKSTCEIREQDKCIFITFFIDDDLQ